MDSDQQSSTTPQQGQQASVPPAPVAKKKSKKALVWSLVAAGAALILLIGLVVAVLAGKLSLGGPKKYDYQQVVDAGSAVNSGYTDYGRQILGRAYVETEETFEDLNAELYDRNHNPWLINEATWRPVEDKERAAAKKIAEAEPILDKLAESLNDEQAQQKYQEYKNYRTKMYGEHVDAVGFAEAAIQAQRFMRACKIDESKQTATPTLEDAKNSLLYVETCRAVLQPALKEGVIKGEIGEQFTIFEAYLSEVEPALRQMIDAGQVNQSEIDAIGEKHRKSISDTLSSERDDKEEYSIMKLQDKLREYTSYIVERRNDAPGSYTR